MKKLTALFLIGILCVFSAAAQTPVELDAAIQQASKDIYGRFFDSPLALLSCAAPTDAMSAYVLKELALALEKTGGAMVSRTTIDRALAESNTKSNADINDASAMQIGRRLGARLMVTAVMEKTGETYRLRTRLISIATGKMELTTTANIRDSALVQQLIPPPSRPAAAPTPAPAPAPAAATPTPAPAAPAPAASAYKIGDTGPAGGLIFYDKGSNSDGWRYLEAAPKEAEFQAVWSDNSFNVNNNDYRTRSDIGFGKRNTQSIVEKFREVTGNWNTAAQKANDLSFNGFNDWFLPSQTELDQIFGNLKRRNLGDFKNEIYWTSTEYDSWRAYGLNFKDGKVEEYSKSGRSVFYVRPIRQF